MERRTLFTGAAALGATAAIAGCGGFTGDSGGDADGKTQITLFHRWPNEPNKSYFEGMAERFEKANPGITVKIDAVLNDTYKDKVRVSVGSPNAPDVFFSWSGSFASSVVETGNVADLGDAMGELETPIIENQLEPFQIEGEQVGLPITMNGKMFFYNRKILDSAGIEVPETWGDLLAACEKLKGEGVVPISFGSKAPWTIAHYFGTLNGRILPADTVAADADPTKGEFTDPGYVKALEHFAELLPFMSDSPNSYDHQRARDAWLAGEAAMCYLETSEWSYIEDESFEWGTFNFPSFEDGEGDQTALTGAPEGLMIAENSAHPEEARKLLEFILSTDESVQWTNASGYLSPVEGVAAQSDAPDSVKALGDEIAQASSMTPWLDTYLDQRVVATYLAQGQQLIAGDATPEDVMAAVQDVAKQVRG